MLLAWIGAFITWMSLDVYQSHYIAGLRTLGDTKTESIVGVPKEGRGDEWSTYIPILKQAYLEGFPEYSNLKPYFEKLNWFIAIPHFNISLIFLPNYLAYWLVPGGDALSFQGFFYNSTFIISVAWLLVNLGVKRRYAMACAFMLLCSQFYQVWWTSNFPILGMSLLPFAVLTSRMRRPYKFVLLAWCMAQMLFGEMYPPFYVSIAVAMVPFVYAARPDLLNKKDLILVVAATALALACYLALNWEFFQAVSHTSYPGQRINTGGGSTVKSLLGVVFPTLPADASGGDLTNLYTLAVGGTILPLLLLSLTPQVKWDKRSMRLTVVVAAVVAFCVIYMLVGISKELAMVTGLYLVPGPRMAIGLSLLIALYSITMISWSVDAFRPLTLLIVAILYLVVSEVSGPGKLLQANFFAIQYYQWIFICLVIAAIACFYCLRSYAFRRDVAITLILCGMAFAHIFIYGSFNPIMHAKDILKPVHSQVINDWLALYKKNGDKPFGLIGSYGHLLRGENLPALEAIHLANVTTKHYKDVFPDLSDSEIDQLFNQFRGIAFANVEKMNASGATVIFPVRPYAVPFTNAVEHDSNVGSVDSLSSEHVTVSASRISSDHFLVRWESSLLSPMPISEYLVLHMSCVAADSWVTRFPVVIAGSPVVPVALRGVAGQIIVQAPTGEAAEKCVSGLRISERPVESNRPVVSARLTTSPDQVLASGPFDANG